MRKKGSAGGHNGLQNIQDLNGGQDYARLKVGVGNDIPPVQILWIKNHVLFIFKKMFVLFSNLRVEPRIFLSAFFVEKRCEIDDLNRNKDRDRDFENPVIRMRFQSFKSQIDESVKNWPEKSS